MRMTEEDKEEGTKVEGLYRFAAVLVDELGRLRAHGEPLRGKEIDAVMSTLISVYQVGHHDALVSLGRMILREEGRTGPGKGTPP